MVEQLRNPEQVELLRADFFARNEPNAAWSHTIGNHLMIPALRGFWPMSANHATSGHVYVDDISCDYDLEMINNPLLFQVGYGLPPACGFTSASSQYLTYGADDVQHDILGTETNVLAAQRGLSLGCWVRFTVLGTNVGIISKWNVAGAQYAYLLMKSNTNLIYFFVSGNGIAFVSVNSAAVAIDTWYFVMGRFVPSTTIDLYVDNVRASNAVGTPASIFDSSQPLEIGRFDGAANYLDGVISLAWLSASTCWDGVAGTRDVIPWALYEHSKRLFNK
jgi:hypothetical protein